jgi:hypothetical protein
MATASKKKSQKKKKKKKFKDTDCANGHQRANEIRTFLLQALQLSLTETITKGERNQQQRSDFRNCH